MERKYIQKTFYFIRCKVGKTYSVLTFGKQEYENMAYFNFETDTRLKETFEENINPDYLIPILSRLSNQSIIKEKIFIFFDEIQLCEIRLSISVNKSLNII